MSEKPISVRKFSLKLTSEFKNLYFDYARWLKHLLDRLGDGVVMHVKACEWVRYYQERYPRVGYLMSCSSDGLNYHLINPRLRLQRTTTLMEGGPLCDFRIYAVGGTNEE